MFALIISAVKKGLWISYLLALFAVIVLASVPAEAVTMNLCPPLDVRHADRQYTDCLPLI